jgi:hypothetical protein
MDSGHSLYGTSLCQNFCGTTYSKDYPDFQTFQQSFMSEDVIFTSSDGAPSSHNGWADQITISLVSGRKLKKTVVRTYTLANSS